MYILYMINSLLQKISSKKRSLILGIIILSRFLWSNKTVLFKYVKGVFNNYGEINTLNTFSTTLKQILFSLLWNETCHIHYSVVNLQCRQSSGYPDLPVCSLVLASRDGRQPLVWPNWECGNKWPAASSPILFWSQKCGV